MSTMNRSRFVGTLRTGALAGIAGGFAEIAWIVIYGVATGAPTEPIARGITATIIPALVTSSLSAWIGILIHLILAGALGLGLAVAVRLFSPRDNLGTVGFVMLALAAVWAVNFLVVLPQINPQFVVLLPYNATLLSKLLFGLSAAIVFKTRRRAP